MKIQYHIITPKGNKQLEMLLDSQNIKYDDFMGHSILFDIFSDTPSCDEMLACLNDSRPLKWAVYSKDDMEAAQWFIMRPIRQIVYSQDENYTFEYSCPYQTSCGYLRYHHQTQVKPFLLKKIPKWKPKFNFASESAFSLIFCSDEAKETLIQNEILGIDFRPVLKSDKTTPREGIHQLVFPNTLSIDSFDFIGSYREDLCPECKKVINYVFEEPMLDNFRIKPDTIPSGIDAFSSDFLVYEGWGEKLIVVSKKVYKIIKKDMAERNVNFIPVG